MVTLNTKIAEIVFYLKIVLKVELSSVLVLVFCVQMSYLGILVLQLMNYLFYKGPPEHHIQMTIDFMDISDNGYDACYHWLEVRYNLMGQDGPE